MAEPRLNAAYLALGSNIRPVENLREAVRLLTKYGTIRRVSRVWESPPADGSGQPHYLNAAVLFDTPLSARALRLDAIASIEESLGRVRVPHDKNAPRTIDIDIALFNRDVLTIDHRRVPDPEIACRRFLTQPLAELDPDYVHPELGITLAEIARQLSAGAALRARDDVRLADVAIGAT
jgi:2-amino-4-hydroxy-6-hydroxymethyldihydropteridine diphosphokinase